MNVCFSVGWLPLRCGAVLELTSGLPSRLQLDVPRAEDLGDSSDLVASSLEAALAEATELAGMELCLTAAVVGELGLVAHLAPLPSRCAANLV